MEAKTIKLVVKENKDFDYKNEFYDEVNYREVYDLAELDRSDNTTQSVQINEDDTIELVFEDGLIWYSTPDDFAEIIDLQSQQRSSDGVPVISRSSAIQVGFERGNLLVRKIVRFGVLIASRLISKGIASKMEKVISDDLSGTVHVLSSTQIEKIKSTSIKRNFPALLMIHGTGSNTLSSFGSVLQDNQLFETLRKEYHENIFAFEHATWSKSPFQNLLELVKELPDKIELHLLTYSRGGLIGDLLCLLSQYAEEVLSDENVSLLIDGYSKQLDDNELKLFDKRYTDELNAILSDLKSVFIKKEIKVSRYVRVACPAAGTTLLSDRLDIYFNVILNLISKGVVATTTGLNPVIGAAVKKTFKAIRTVAAEVLRERANVHSLPGLEAMRPESPFMSWMNQFDNKLKNINLYVVTGNSQINTGIWRMIKTVTTKLYFLRKNDFVVDTVSMYAGTRFQSSAQYYVENGVIDHFRYFENKKVKELVTAVLGKEEEKVSHSKPFIAGEENTYYRDRGVAIKKHEKRIKRDVVTGKKPVIILVPGIMGSHLDHNDNHIWLNFGSIHKGQMRHLNAKEKVKTDFIVGSAYLKFCQYFEAKYDILTVSYDWRSDLKNAAVRLEEVIISAESKALGQQIVIVAHSMGGLVVKHLMMKNTATYDRLSKRRNFKLVFLGTPWRGSYLVPYTLLGYGRNINVVSLIDIVHSKADLLDIFREYEGFLQMLPQIREEGIGSDDFGSVTIWNKLKSIKGKNIGKPTPGDIKKVQTYFDDVSQFDFSQYLTTAYYIAGWNDKTVAGINTGFTTWFGKKKLKFSKTKLGDGSVTWKLGIPEEFRNEGKERLYYSTIEHGQLANDESNFRALEDIFKTGSTNKLTTNEPRFRSDEVAVEEFGEESFVTDVFNFEKDILGLSDDEVADFDTPLRVSMIAGDLRNAKYPVMLGHFWQDGILNAEKALNRYLNNELEKQLRTGTYPQWIGDHYVYIDPKRSIDYCQGAVVLGLGNPINFNAIMLSATVRSGVIGYIREMARLKDFVGMSNDKELGITTLLVGSGFGNLQVAESIRALIKGIRQANEYIAREEEELQLVTQLEIIELYVNKAEEAMYELCVMEDQEYDEYYIELKSHLLKEITGTREEMPYKDKRNWWQPFIISSFKNEKNGKIEISFSTEIKAARSQKRQVTVNAQFLDTVSSEFAVSSEWDPKLAKVMFEILIPNEFKAYIKHQNNLKLNLDKRTANYPWEMIHDKDTGQDPLCINAGMIRQLQATREELGVLLSTGRKALVIGDPLLHGYISQLPGAKMEAEEVDQLLSTSNTFETTPLVNTEYRDVIIELFSDQYRILHIAAHGIVEGDDGAVGVVIGDGHILSASDIRQMSRVPELVFINCCHLGQIEGVDQKFYQNRHMLASSLSTQFIESGARVVIAAGWAIHDGAARVFANTFYSEMLAGNDFHIAVKAARKKIYDDFPKTNTWGAYQCYGDPYYKFDLRNSRTSDDGEYQFYIPKEVSIELKYIRAQATQKRDPDSINKLVYELSKIVKAAESKNLLTTKVKEELAFCYADLDLLPEAIDLVEDLMKVEKANFSLYLIEQYVNWKIKDAITKYDTGNTEDITEDEEQIAQNRANRGKEAEGVILETVALLDQLISRGRSAERYALKGSAYRRKTLVSTTATDDMNVASQNYYQAYKFNDPKNRYYHLSNWLLMELLLSYQSDEARQVEHYLSSTKIEEQIELLLDSINKNSNQDFWRYAATVHHRILDLLCNYHKDSNTTDLSQYESEICEIYSEAWNRSGTNRDKRGELEHIRLIRSCLEQNDLAIFFADLELKLNDQIFLR